MDNAGIKFISASAGSGKTYSLTRELLRGIKEEIAPEGVVATTFTNKAANELIERVRFGLLSEGRWEEAQRILDGYIGTVNSVCGRILKDFALEAGLSPTMDVLPEGEARTAFDLAISPVISKYAVRLESAANRCGIEDWRKTVKAVIDQARANGIAAERLHECAASSWESFLNLLPGCYGEKDARVLDRSLWEAIDSATAELALSEDSTKKTQKVKDQLQDIRNRFGDAASLPWSEWVKLEKLDPAVKTNAIIEPVKAEASKHSTHPRFQSDLRELITSLFACAADSMRAFADYKKVHGLVDFVDQEMLAFDLLQKSRIRQRLSEELEILCVDEFQDTNPIQLALFVELAGIIGRSVWVGDQKQAIYGFRGTDSVLMDGVMEGLIEEKNVEILPNSYRSRPGLVEFTSELFAAAFSQVGIPEEKVRLTAKRPEEKGLQEGLQVWRLQAKNANQEAGAIAAGVKDLIAHSPEYRVHDRNAGLWRALRSGDIAVLCRTNRKCRAIAAALESCGIRAAIPRIGLLLQPECILAMAALRYLVDGGDSLAAAEIVHFSAGSHGAGRWFDEWVEEAEANPWKHHPLIVSLDAKRERMLHLTPCESLECAMDAVSADRRALAWFNAKTRLANLDRLRSFALEYENRCLTQRTAASAAGLITYMKELAKDGTDAQAEGRDDRSVEVLTYHGAKGLEWPFVILADLQSGERANAFGVRSCSPRRGFDAGKPLAGRSIRFWPWPYGRQKKIDWLDEALAKTREQEETVLSEKKELIRVLYVGMTRARDYMTLAVRDNGKNATAWLDELVDANGRGLIEIPLDPGFQQIRVGSGEFPATVFSFEPREESEKLEDAPVFTVDTGLVSTGSYPPALFYPSRATVAPGSDYVVVSRHKLGGRIALGSTSEIEVVGEVCHRFLAADKYESTRQERIETALRLLSRWKVDSFEAESLVGMSDRLKTFVDNHISFRSRWRREWPVRMKLGDQKLTGWVDLLMDSPEGFIVIDHKSFPGPFEQWESKALGYAPQLALYKKAVETATGRPVLKMMVHMPVIGWVFEIRSENSTGI